MGRFLYHHWSYAPEHRLDVIALCLGCHMRIHYGTLPEPRTGRIYDNRRRKGVTALALDGVADVRRVRA